MIRRWLIRGLALMMLTLCLVAWGVSYWRELYAVHNGNTRLVFALNSGRIFIAWTNTPGAMRGWFLFSEEAFGWNTTDRLSMFCWLGFSFSVDGSWPYFTIPLWFPSVLSLLLLWFAWRKTRRKPAGKAFPIEPSIEAKSPSA